MNLLFLKFGYKPFKLKFQKKVFSQKQRAHSDILSPVKVLFIEINAKFKENCPWSNHKEELLQLHSLKKKRPYKGIHLIGLWPFVEG